MDNPAAEVPHLYTELEDRNYNVNLKVPSSEVTKKVLHCYFLLLPAYVLVFVAEIRSILFTGSVLPFVHPLYSIKWDIDEGSHPIWVYY